MEAPRRRGGHCRIGDDMDYVRISAHTVRIVGLPRLLTNHVALLVLPSSLAGNMALDGQENHHAIFQGILLQVEAANNTKPFPVVDVIA